MPGILISISRTRNFHPWKSISRDKNVGNSRFPNFFSGILISGIGNHRNFLPGKSISRTQNFLRGKSILLPGIFTPGINSTIENASLKNRLKLKKDLDPLVKSDFVFVILVSELKRFCYCFLITIKNSCRVYVNNILYFSIF